MDLMIEIIKDFRTLLILLGTALILLGIVAKIQTKWFSFYISNKFQKVVLIILGVIFITHAFLPFYLDSSSSIDNDRIIDFLKKRLTEQINYGQSFIDSNQNQDFNFQEWRNNSIHILKLFDQLTDNNYTHDFTNETEHVQSKIFLNEQSVRKGLVILKSAKTIIVTRY